MSKPLTLGIDLGGTGIKLGLVTASGRLIKTLKFSTPLKHSPQDTSLLIAKQAKVLLNAADQKRIHGIGVGAAGDIDLKSGVIRLSPNLGWRDVPLKKLLSRWLKYPITIDNDANVAAWAAYVVEAKRKIKNLICVTVGTGIGGGIVIDGTLYRGTTGSAGEIGHITLYPEGVSCPCGNFGCLERYVGARAMCAEARRAIESGASTLIPELLNGDLSALNPMVLEQAARKNDPLALHLWDQAGERLGIALSSLINVLNPEWIVLAGGLSRAGDLLLNPLNRTIFKRSFPAPAAAARLIISKLDHELGIVGAGLIAH